MRTFILITGFLIVTLVPAYSQPKLEVVGGTTFDFGDIIQGKKVERKVSLMNVGKDTLRIDRVQAGCGCTATLLEAKTVPPGKTTSVNITFDSHNFSGPVSKEVTVYSNDSSNADAKIKFTANITQLLAPNPTYFYFVNGKVDSAMTSTIKLKNVSKETIKILSATCELPKTEITVKQKQLKPEEETELTATFTPTKEGYVSRDVVIKTSNTQQPEMNIKLFCNVRPVETFSKP